MRYFSYSISILISGIALFISTTSFAQGAFPCSSCESCSRALSAIDTKVVLVADIVQTQPGPCVVVSGNRAQFDGAEHDIRPTSAMGSVGILVESNDVLIKNIHIMGAEKGIVIKGADRATIFHAWLDSTGQGIEVVDSAGFRVTRSVIIGGQEGISFGKADGEACSPNQPLANPEAVINKTHIEGTNIGVVACDAVPVIKHSTITRNKTGVLQGQPTGKDVQPIDPCICKPDLSDVSAGSAFLFSSGCHACKVHEEWLPALREAGHNILLRQTGPGNRGAMLTYDAFIDRCIPQLTDAVGIPGCVPNYGCMTNDISYKVREGKKQLKYETEILSSEAVANFERNCRLSAQKHYGEGEACVRHPLHDNIICNNTELDIRSSARPSQGADNACSSTSGFRDQNPDGCDRVCPDTISAPVIADSWEPDFPKPPPPTPPAPATTTKPPKENVKEAVTKPETKAATETNEAIDPGAQANKKGRDTPKESNKGMIIGALLALFFVFLLLWRRKNNNPPEEP